MEPRPPTASPPSGGAPGFLLGLVVGSVVSAAVQVPMWKNADQLGIKILWILLALVIGKLTAATVASYSREWKSVGAGIFASLAVGFLIFFGLCASAFKGI